MYTRQKSQEDHWSHRYRDIPGGNRETRAGWDGRDRLIGPAPRIRQRFWDTTSAARFDTAENLATVVTMGTDVSEPGQRPPNQHGQRPPSQSGQRPTPPTLTDGVVTLRPDAAQTRRPDDTGEREFVIEVAGTDVGRCSVRLVDEHVGALNWELHPDHRRRGYATRAARMLVDYALTAAGQGGLGLGRVELHLDPRDTASMHIAIRAGLHREGVLRLPPDADHDRIGGYVVLSRLSSDPPLSEPDSFRTLLNSFLPRKRAIGQLLIRDTTERVLLCQLTYKSDWDLPGGVVEVGESPRLAAQREVAEELGLSINAGDLLLTDWMPSWRGWDDALCLVFDGGHHEPELTDRVVAQAREIRTAEFCSPEQIDDRCADFTARRIAAALSTDGVGYTESGRLS